MIPHIIYLPLARGIFAKVDLDCPDHIWRQKWSVNKKSILADGSSRPYAYRTIPGTKRHEYLHHVVLGVTPGAYEVDHINGDTLDNRRENLRACLHSENGRNLRKWSTATSSKFKGVSFHKPSRQWRAYINVRGKQKHLGCFSTEEVAATAYDAAAKEIFGEYAKLNF